MKRLIELASQHDLKPFEDLWNETIAGNTSNVEGLLEAISALESQGQFGKAASFLNSLLPCYLDDANANEAAILCLKRLAKVSARDRNLRENFLKVFRRKYAENPGIETCIEHSGVLADMNIAEAVDKLESYLNFTPGAYLEHPAGWGVGIVSAVDHDEATVTIDFRDMPGHELGFEMARNITRYLAPDNFKAMKFDRLSRLQTMAEENPVDLVRCVITSRERKTTVRDLRDRITDGVIPVKDWSKWWTKTRSKVKRDPNFKMGTGNNPLIEVTVAELAFEDQTLTNMAALRGLPKKIKYVRELFAEIDSHPETRPALIMAAGVLAKIAAEEKKKHPGATLSLALMLEKVAQIKEDYTIPEALRLEALLADPYSFLETLSTVPIAADRKDILARVRDNFPDIWPEIYEKALYLGESDVCDFCLRELLTIGAFDRATRAIFDFLNKFREFRGSYLWYVKLCLKGGAHKALPHPGLTSLLEKVLLLHSHCNNRFMQGEADAEDYRKECRSIEKVLEGKNCQLIRKTLGGCNTTEALDFYNMIRGSRSLPDDVKDSLVAAVIRTRPEVARLRAEAEEEHTQQPGFIDERVIYVTATGYRRYEAAYNSLVNDDIPKNAAEINRAASFGDLSENAEWSAAIEKQTALTQKAEEMREALEKARIIDTSLVNGESVAVGCRVRLTNLDSNAEESYTLLGPWDVDMEKKIISYLSPLGRGLLGRSVGTETEVELPAGRARYRILDIQVAPTLIEEQREQSA
ncbi:MAG: transcription elongation factor GreA [Planctomycetes bacterium]|nr:transcription elongation factor GreA [Planctomycetota bacterium]